MSARPPATAPATTAAMTSRTGQKVPNLSENSVRWPKGPVEAANWPKGPAQPGKHGDAAASKRAANPVAPDHPTPAWLTPRSLSNTKCGPTAISSTASLLASRALPLGSTPRLTEPGSHAETEGRATAPPTMRVSQQQELHLPAVKSARARALAAHLNLSPRLCNPDARSEIMLRRNPSLLLAGSNDRRATSVRTLRHGSGAYGNSSGCGTGGGSGNGAYDFDGSSARLPDSPVRTAPEDAPSTADTSELAPAPSGSLGTYQYVPDSDAPSFVGTRQRSSSPAEGKHKASAASVALDGSSMHAATPRVLDVAQAVAAGIAELQDLIYEHEKLKHALRRAIFRREKHEEEMRLLTGPATASQEIIDASPVLESTEQASSSYGDRAANGDAKSDILHALVPNWDDGELSALQRDPEGGDEASKAAKADSVSSLPSVSSSANDRSLQRAREAVARETADAVRADVRMLLDRLSHLRSLGSRREEMLQQLNVEYDQLVRDGDEGPYLESQIHIANLEEKLEETESLVQQERAHTHTLHHIASRSAGDVPRARAKVNLMKERLIEVTQVHADLRERIRFALEAEATAAEMIAGTRRWLKEQRGRNDNRKQVLQDRVNYRKAMRNKATSLDFLDALMAGKPRHERVDKLVEIAARQFKEKKSRTHHFQTLWRRMCAVTGGETVEDMLIFWEHALDAKKVLKQSEEARQAQLAVLEQQRLHFYSYLSAIRQMTADEDVPIADKHWLQLESSAYTAETRLTRLQERNLKVERLRKYCVRQIRQITGKLLRKWLMDQVSSMQRNVVVKVQMQMEALAEQLRHLTGTFGEKANIATSEKKLVQPAAVEELFVLPISEDALAQESSTRDVAARFKKRAQSMWQAGQEASAMSTVMNAMSENDRITDSRQSTRQRGDGDGDGEPRRAVSRSRRKGDPETHKADLEAAWTLQLCRLLEHLQDIFLSVFSLSLEERQSVRPSYAVHLTTEEQRHLNNRLESSDEEEEDEDSSFHMAVYDSVVNNSNAPTAWKSKRAGSRSKMGAPDAAAKARIAETRQFITRELLKKREIEMLGKASPELAAKLGVSTKLEQLALAAPSPEPQTNSAQSPVTKPGHASLPKANHVQLSRQTSTTFASQKSRSPGKLMPSLVSRKSSRMNNAQKLSRPDGSTASFEKGASGGVP